METIRYSLLGLEDLKLGQRPFEVRLADGRVVTLNGINLSNLGEESGTTLPVAVPKWAGISFDSSDDTAKWQSFHNNDIPSSGAFIWCHPGVSRLSDTLEITKPLVIQGAGVDVTVLEMTTTASLQHLLNTTQSIVLRDLTLRVLTPPTGNLSMKAINLDEPVSTGLHVILDNVKIRGFNFGLYVDGGITDQVFNVDRVLVQHCDIQISGAASTVANCFSVHGCNLVDISQNLIDNNLIGDHALYVIRNKSLHVHHNRIKNTRGDAACAVKAVTELVADTGTLDHWAIEDNYVENTSLPFLLSLTGSIVLRHYAINRNTIKDATSTLAADGAAGLVSLASTSILNHYQAIGNTLENLTLGGFKLDGAAGTIIRNAEFIGNYFRNWSTSSVGTYVAITTGSLGTYANVTIRDAFGDGNNNGHSLVGGIQAVAGITRMTLENIREINVVTGSAAALVPTFTDLDATPSVARSGGAVRTFLVSNTGATTITQLDDGAPGMLVCLIGTNANTTLPDGTNFKLLGDWTSANQKTLLLTTDNGTQWFEIGRSAN